MRNPIPVTTRIMMEDNGSRRNAQFTEKRASGPSAVCAGPASIQLYSVTVCDRCSGSNCKSWNTAPAEKMNDSKTAPAAIVPMAFFDRRLPRRPLMTKPIAGKSGISQIRSRKFIFLSSPLHQVDFVDVHRLFVLEHCDHNPETDGSFSGRHRDDKDSEYLAGHLLKAVRKRNQIDVHGIHHQFDGHQD